MIEKVHLIGIGGTGLSAIARVLVEQGIDVSGSDQNPSPLADELVKIGVNVYFGHKADLVEYADVVLRSSAVPDTNVEVIRALELGIPVVKRIDFFPELLEGRIQIAAAGTHGKTTTSAMMAWVLTALNREPGYIIGGVVQNLGRNAAAGEGPHFVIEADEYDFMFHGLQPTAAIIMNIEHDHPDCYPTPRSFRKAFEKFVTLIKAGGTLVACADDNGVRRLLNLIDTKNLNVRTYGFFEGVDYQADYTARSLKAVPGKGYQFELFKGNQKLAGVSLQVPGVFNVLNAMGALIALDAVQVPIDEAAQALADFTGTGRRFDVMGEKAGVVIVDDYAHHPTEIRSTIKAAKDRYPGREIRVVWQPHTYSRTDSLKGEYSTAFYEADHVMVTNVYAAREEVPEGFSLAKIVHSLKGVRAVLSGSLENTTIELIRAVQPNTVVLVLSAGDAVKISTNLFLALTDKALLDKGLLDKEKQNER